MNRIRITVTGVVQGVGYRPYVHRLAVRHGLGGFALNDGRGVLVEVEGARPALDSFRSELKVGGPPLARVDGLDEAWMAPRGEDEFRIEPSAPGPATALVPADAPTCEACLEELGDPSDRRHRYPFINCTECGPRFTIVRRPPYDRARTTMAGFELCAACRAEYEDPRDRRFHAEAIACPDCGPRLALAVAGEEGQTGIPVRSGDAALAEAVETLKRGGIVAVKGLGGYHLACDAGDETAVARLRRRKHRDRKPFAVMSPHPEALAEPDPAGSALLSSACRPIVLLRRRAIAPIAPAVAPGSSWIGLMLPYTPLHHLLCSEIGRPLVMTSGNRSDEPIATGDQEARERLGGIADAFLTHDRAIHRRCEDSVVRSIPGASAQDPSAPAGIPIRRSRGLVPGPLRIGRRCADPVLAVGAELKSTFCVLRGEQAFLSPHLGDLDTPLAYEAFRADLGLYLEMLGVRPGAVAHDLHPDFLSTRWALEQDAEAVGVQHHHAHAAACLAENDHEGPAIALVLDGTGYGEDGTIWGGEVMRCDLAGSERLAHLDPVPMPGGEAAVREPWRMAGAYLERAGRPVPWEHWPEVRESLKVNAPLSSGTGRLFDAAAALLGVRERVSYEGQAAIELEQLAGDTEADPYDSRIEDGIIRGADLIAAVHDDLDAGRPREEIAAAFHEGVAATISAACAASADPGEPVALSGGCFQNLRLLSTVTRRLDRLGLTALTHRRVPPNDGGISFGQAAIAARRVEEMP